MTAPEVIVAAGRGLVRRFTRAERWVHWSTAVLFGVCAITGLFLYVGPLAVLVGRRALLESLHVYAGLALPVPALLGWFSRAYREDIAALNRFTTQERQWLRRGRMRERTGKFNNGQKLAASVMGGAILVMLGTGVIMWLPEPWPLPERTGATFVHDLVALGFGVLVVGHMLMALNEPVLLRAMWTGDVPADDAGRRPGQDR